MEKLGEHKNLLIWIRIGCEWKDGDQPVQIIRTKVGIAKGFNTCKLRYT